MDTAVMSDVRGQRCSTSTSRARLQPRQFPAHGGDARADQRLVADEPEGEAHQDRREGRQAWPLRRLPDGRGRHSEKLVRRYPAVDRGTAATTCYIDRVRRSIVISALQTMGEVRLDDNEISISGARRAVATGMGARETPC